MRNRLYVQKNFLSFLLLSILLFAIPFTLFIGKQRQTITQQAAINPSDWSAWNTLSGVGTETPSAAVFQNQLYVFSRGTQNEIFMKYSSNGMQFSDWQNLNGVATSAPSAVTFNNRIYIFTKGVDNTIYFKSSTDGTNYSPWTTLGGVATSAPTTVVFNGQLYLYVRGTGDTMYVKTTNDGVNFGNWQSLFFTLAGSPAATVFQNKLYLFNKEATDTLTMRSSLDGINFTNSQDLGGVLTSDPATTTITFGAPYLYVFVKGTTNTVYERHTTDGVNFSPWINLDAAREFAQIQFGPSAVSFQSLIHIVAIGKDNLVWRRSIRPDDTSGAPQIESGKAIVLPDPDGLGTQYSPFLMQNPQNNNYLMYYCRSGDGFGDRVWRAELANDGKTGALSNTLVIQGTSNTEDALSCSPGIVIDAIGTWHMYYITANTSAGLVLYIHHAASSVPGTIWQKLGRITVQGSPQPFTDYYLETPSPLLINGKIVMYIVGKKGMLYRIESSDGTNFSQFSQVNVPEGATHGHVKYYNGIYYYIYSRLPLGETYDQPIPDDWSTSDAIFLTTSTDGINFSGKKLLSKTDGISWDGKNQWSPDVMFTPTEMKLYYAADNSNYIWNPLADSAIGMKWFPNPNPPASPTQTITPIPPTVTPTPVSGDTNNDGRVDIQDIKGVLQNWLRTLTNSLDQFADGRINAIDFVKIIKQLP